MLLGMRSSLLSSVFSPASLFAAGEPGAWYDPSDMTTLFQDITGAAPVTAVEQPVGLMLDKSKGLATSANLLTNAGPFTNTTGWTGSANCVLSTSSGRLLATYAATDTFYQAITVEAGKWYFVNATLRRDSGTGTAYYMNFRNGTTLASSVVGNFQSGGATSATDVMLYANYFATSSGTIYLHFPCVVSTSTVVSLASVSLVSIAGNHASQSTSASRPVLSARYNLLTKTEAFDDASWVRTAATIPATNGIAPDGTATAETVRENTANDTHGIAQSPAPAVSALTAYTVSAYFKREAGVRNSLIQVNNNVTGTGGACFVWFDLQAGTASVVTDLVPGFTAKSAEITSVGSGWYRCVLKLTTVASTTSISTFFGIYNSARVYTGDGTSGIYIWGADLRATNDGVGLPAYQRVNTATDYTTTGFPMYLRFDGVDDSMVTNTITPGVDKAQAFAGVRKLSDAADRGLVDYGPAWATQIGSFGVYAPSYRTGGLPAPKYTVGLKGSTGVRDQEYATYTAPISNVLAVAYDLSAVAASEAIVRINGAAATALSAGGDAGGGNFGALALQIGRYGGSPSFNGRLFPLIVRFGPNLTTDQITNTETWVNGKTKAFAS